jgi:hemolysin activation/secretion protein
MHGQPLRYRDLVGLVLCTPLACAQAQTQAAASTASTAPPSETKTTHPQASSTHFKAAVPPSATQLIKPAVPADEEPAQGTFQITPRPSGAQGLVLPPVESLLPKPQETTTIERVSFRGNTRISSVELEQVAQPFMKRVLVGGAELENLRQAISAYYIAQGYINSGAIIQSPPDAQGHLVVDIVEGRLSAIRITGQERLATGYITDKLWPDAARPLDMTLLQENFQKLLRDPLFKKMNSNVRPGEGLGTAILDLNVERARPWEFSIFVDNYRSPASGQFQTGFAGTLRNLTGWGDWLTVSGGVADAADNYGIAFNMPLPKWDTVLAVSYNKGNSVITEKPFDRLDFSNDSNTLVFSIKQPLINTLQTQLIAGIDQVQQESQNYAAGEPTSFALGEDNGYLKNKALRSHLTLSLSGREHSFAVRYVHTQGHNSNVIDARFPAGIIAEKRYKSDGLEAFYTRRLTDGGVAVVFRGAQQRSNNILLGMERYAVTSSSAVRGYIQNAYAYDRATVYSVELAVPLVSSPDIGLSVAPFYDAGEGQNNNSRPSATDHLHFSATGLALNAYVGRLSASITYANALNNKDLLKGKENWQSKGLLFQARYNF